MFSPSDFSRPTPPPPSSLFDNRLLGAALLVIAIIVLVLMAVTYDQQLFIPFNATYAITQTFQAQHTRVPVQPRNQTPQPRRRNDDLQSVNFEVPLPEITPQFN